DVLKVRPDRSVREKKCEIYTGRYDQVKSMMLNELLKEHKAFIEEQCKVQQQGATITQQRKDFEAAIAQQQKQIDALNAALQKVSAQLEVSKAAPQTVLNNQ